MVPRTGGLTRPPHTVPATRVSPYPLRSWWHLTRSVWVSRVWWSVPGGWGCGPSEIGGTAKGYSVNNLFLT